jgi:subtilase family serine protease
MYGPAQLRAAYDVPSDTTGVGQTIVIIAAFHSPAVKADLAAFDPSCLPGATACLSVMAPDGTTPFDPSQVPWFIEESTDVEWAHAIAPGAHLILVEAKTGDDADLLSATKFAIDNNLGDVISMSFSEAESCPSADFLADEHAAFERAVAQGITLVAASGDSGPFQHSCTGPFVQDVGTPASDPLVTAVGGTNLTLDASTHAYGSEVAWAGSGGGFSSVYRRPSYQAPFNKSEARGVPDVAWHASPSFPTLIIANGHMHPTAGTSVATAEWAGVVAVADQAAGHRLGLLNELLYHAAKSDGESDRFHDISSGKHAWDAVTGLGTPDVAILMSWIAAHS